MKHCHLQLIRIVLIAKLHAAMLSSTEDVFLEMSELTDLCPYTSFCNQNASSPFPYSGGYKPCCQSCSCDPDCGFHGNCCFDQLDKFYTESAQAIVCRSAFVVEPSEQELPDAHLYRYRMINVCRNDDSGTYMNGTSCEQLSSDTVEAFHPVVSRYTGFIYTNVFCALCNNVPDVIPWRRAVTCSPNAETILSETLERFFSGNQSTVLSGCHVYYTPPSDFDISPAQSCHPFVKRTCNKDYFNETSQYWKFCEKFNATFILPFGSILHSYANVYCFLCNIESFNAYQFKIQNQQCIKSDYLNKYKSVFGFQLTVLLELPSQDRHPVSKGKEEKSDCPINSVSVTLLKNECRKVRCPWGQFLLNNRCGYYSKMWAGGPFFVTLRLLPVERNALIPSSFFNDMPENYKNDRQAPWLNRKTLRRWKFLVLYHQHQYKSAVEYIVVKATYPSASVNPQHLKKMLREALDDTWRIHYKNSSFYFSVAFNEYTRYDGFFQDSVRELGLNITGQLGYYPVILSCLGISPGTYYFKELLHQVSTFKQGEIHTGIPITKSFFCDQVDLLPNEYDYDLLCAAVFFKVKNITIHNFGTVRSSQTEFSDPSIRVCLHEFDHAFNFGLVTSFRFVTYFTIFFISVFSEMFFA